MLSRLYNSYINGMSAGFLAKALASPLSPMRFLTCYLVMRPHLATGSFSYLCGYSFNYFFSKRLNLPAAPLPPNALVVDVRSRCAGG